MLHMKNVRDMLFNTGNEVYYNAIDYLPWYYIIHASSDQPLVLDGPSIDGCISITAVAMGNASAGAT